MIQILRYRPSPAMAVALISLLVALGGVAFATIPDPSGEIHGCFKKVNGDLRLVDSAAACRKNEKAIQWNQQGPPGVGAGNVVARARGTASQAATNSFAAYPLADNTWTQKSNELNEFFGQIAVTPPSDCAPGPLFSPIGLAALGVRIFRDGKLIGFPPSPGGPPPVTTFVGGGEPTPRQLFVGDPQFEPGADIGRTITVEIADNCTQDHFTLDSIHVDVVGFR